MTTNRSAQVGVRPFQKGKDPKRYSIEVRPFQDPKDPTIEVRPFQDPKDPTIEVRSFQNKKIQKDTA